MQCCVVLTCGQTCVPLRVVSCPVVLCSVVSRRPKVTQQAVVIPRNLIKCLKCFACSEVIMNSDRKRGLIVQKE